MDKQALEQLLSNNMTQRDIAKILKISQSTVKYYVAKYELGKTTVRYRTDGLRTCTHCHVDKLLSDFYKKDKKKDVRLSICKKCNISNLSKKRTNFKQACVDYKGGKCISCNYAKSLSALEFHHRCPGEKEFKISECTTRKLENVVEELDKCDLLCSNCHREIHEQWIIEQQ